MAQTARVTLTLSNIATEEDLRSMEARIMSQLSDAIAALRATVENLQMAQNPEQVAQLQAAVQAEREKYEALVAAESAEDVSQNQELADAKAQTDALLAEMNSAATDLGGITAQLAAVGTAVDDAPDEQPVGEVPVEVPAPDSEVQAPADGDVAEPAPAEGSGDVPGEGSTPAPSSPETTDVGVSPDGGAPAEASPAGMTGPVDASGNPVEGPRL